MHINSLLRPMISGSRRLPGALSVVVLAAVLYPAGAPAQDVEPDAPFVPTPMNVVVEMLELAEVSPQDTVYDLGSGDGRLPITAAHLHGAHGVGVELDSALVAKSRRNVREVGVDRQVRFIRGDLFEVNLESATVVTLYLFPEVNERLRPKLFRQLEPGDRVVAHDFSMGDWEADRTREVAGAETARDSIGVVEDGKTLRTEGIIVRSAPDIPELTPRLDSLVIGSPRPVPGPSTVYVWVIPADVEGVWAVGLPGGDSTTIRVDQRFQKLRVARSGGSFGDVVGRLEGSDVRLSFTRADGRTVRLEGTVTGNQVEGRTGRGEPWSARVRNGAGGSILEWEEPPPEDTR